MSGDHGSPPELVATGLSGLIESVRTDIRALDARQREDLAQMEGRVTARVTALEARQSETFELVTEYAKNHGEEHEAEAVERREAHGKFYDFIRAAEVAEARRDGALGVLRFTVEQLSRHSARIVQIVLALAALLGIASGAVSVDVGR
jgi:hypothetical protein